MRVTYMYMYMYMWFSTTCAYLMRLFSHYIQRSRTQANQQQTPLNLNTDNRQNTSAAAVGAASRTEAKHALPDHRVTIENLTAKLKQYKTQIGVLQAQIATFKEDFDSEKADKERYRLQKVEHQQHVTRLTTEVADFRRLITQKDREMEAVRNQNDYVRQQYTQVSTRPRRCRVFLRTNSLFCHFFVS